MFKFKEYGMLGGSDCTCGWYFDEIDSSNKECIRCGRTSEYKKGYWSISSPTKSVDKISTWNELDEFKKYLDKSK